MQTAKIKAINTNQKIKEVKTTSIQNSKGKSLAICLS